MSDYNIEYLDFLESESIHILREVAAEFNNPVMLYSIGKDSSVLLHLAYKAFYPGKIPFPFLHIDTGYKFKEMIEFRDYYTKKIGVELIVHQNTESQAMSFRSEDAGSEEYIYYKKTKPLLEILRKHEFDVAIGGARRDEEKSRAKERFFSYRNQEGIWDPKNQRPELWHTYNTRIKKGEGVRVFPLSNWIEMDIWQYIKREKIEMVPLYFAQQMDLIERNGVYLQVGDHVQPQKGEKVFSRMARFRTLGCAPSTGAIFSSAKDLDSIIKELEKEKISERQNRVIDNNSLSAMEDKKREGYF